MIAGSTPIDFAYHLHTELGHRCRGAKVDGVMVPLNTKLQSGQTVEIITVKVGAPSRDWLNPELGFVASPRSRTKGASMVLMLKKWSKLLLRAEKRLTKILPV